MILVKRQDMPLAENMSINKTSKNSNHVGKEEGGRTIKISTA
jgi:hypothetical protein